MQDGPLDMRMNPTDHPSAAEWLATAEQHEIRDVLRRFGEERHAHRIAWAIVDARAEMPIETTAQLVAVIKQVVPAREQGKHPATKSFQAIRIRINKELEEIAERIAGRPRCFVRWRPLAGYQFSFTGRPYRKKVYA